MDFDLTDEQELLRETTRRFIERRLPIERVRSLVDDGHGWDPAWWREASHLGWTSMLVGEDAVGGGLEGLLDAAVVAEELGSALQPGPFLPTNVVAFALRAYGSDAQRAEVLPPLTRGEVVATWCLAGRDGRWLSGAAGAGVLLTPGGAALEGCSAFVQDADTAQYLLVTAQADDGLKQVLVPSDAPGVTIVPMKCLDAVRRLSVVEFDRVSLSPEADVGGGLTDQAIERQLRVALVLQCADTVGAMDHVFVATAEFATERKAFGRPVGSYQAIKHRLADLLCSLEAAKATTTAATRAVAGDDDEASVLVSVAKAYVAEVAPRLASECQQILGGIGMTWEHDLHLYFRRIITNAALYGDKAEHTDRLRGLLDARAA